MSGARSTDTSSLDDLRAAIAALPLGPLHGAVRVECNPSIYRDLLRSCLPDVVQPSMYCAPTLGGLEIEPGARLDSGSATFHDRQGRVIGEMVAGKIHWLDTPRPGEGGGG